MAWKISKAAVTEARQRGWETRRAKYGQSGHDSTYSRSTVDLSTAVRDRIRLARLAAVLHGDGMLTEAQIARVIDVDLVRVRGIIDEGHASLTYRPLQGGWGTNVMRRINKSATADVD
jgi:hypothetical protein